jgi:hypothetical protein
MACKTCKFLDVPPDRIGRIRPQKRYSYRCVAEIPAPVLPDSVTKAHGFKWPPERTWMAIEQGRKLSVLSGEAR